MSARLTALDGSFLEIEQADEVSHMHVGWAMLFGPLPGGGAPTLDDVRDLLRGRLAALPRFTRRLSSPRAEGLSWPTWERDDGFDVADHVREVALPAPAGEAELLEWLADFSSRRPDRARPLWEMALIRGLADGGWALATKTHHCLVDGISSVDVTQVVLDPTPVPGGAPDGRAPGPGDDDEAGHGLRVPGASATASRRCSSASRWPRATRSSATRRCGARRRG